MSQKTLFDLLKPFIKELFLSEDTEREVQSKRTLLLSLTMTILSIVIFAALLGHGVGTAVKYNQHEEQRMNGPAVSPPMVVQPPLKKEGDEKKPQPTDDEMARRLRRLYELEKENDG